MTKAQRSQLTALEGRQVTVALRGGNRIHDSQLVSAGRHRVAKLWLFTNGDDTFVALDDVVAVWEVASTGRLRAA